MLDQTIASIIYIVDRRYSIKDIFECSMYQDTSTSFETIPLQRKNTDSLLKIFKSSLRKRFLTLLYVPRSFLFYADLSFRHGNTFRRSLESIDNYYLRSEIALPRTRCFTTKVRREKYKDRLESWQYAEGKNVVILRFFVPIFGIQILDRDIM